VNTIIYFGLHKDMEFLDEFKMIFRFYNRRHKTISATIHLPQGVYECDNRTQLTIND
jgi:hypothetical protein